MPKLAEENALDSEYEQAPIVPISPAFRPTGIPYKVSDGESFAELSTFAEMKAWDLIYHNFQTRDPREVNWYLRTITGCQNKDWNLKNYVFSSSDDPGIIYFPRRNYERLKANGKQPGKFWDEDSTFLVGRVPYYRQGLKKVCWAAAGGQLIAWKNPILTNFEDVLSHAGSKWLKKFKDNVALNVSDTLAFAKDARFRASYNMYTEVDDWIYGLRFRGPLMVIDESAAGFVHWIVVVGYRIIAPSKFQLIIQDPGLGGRSYRSSSSVISGANAAKGGGYPAMFSAR